MGLDSAALRGLAELERAVRDEKRFRALLLEEELDTLLARNDPGAEGCPAGAAARWSQRHMAPPQVKHVVTNRSKLGAEMVGAGVSCGLTLVSAAGVALGAAGEVPTGGASTLLIIASWTSFTAGATQCGNGLVRIGAALAHRLWSWRLGGRRSGRRRAQH